MFRGPISVGIDIRSTLGTIYPRIVIARGRDAADLPISTPFGPTRLVRFNLLTEEVVAKGPFRISRASTPWERRPFASRARRASSGRRRNLRARRHDLF